MAKGTEDGKNKVGLITAELWRFIALIFPTNGNENSLLFSKVVSKSERSFLKLQILGNE